MARTLPSRGTTTGPAERPGTRLASSGSTTVAIAKARREVQKGERSAGALPAARQGPVWLLLDSRRPGGIESHVATLAAALRGRGVQAEVVFLADYGPHPMKDGLSARGVPHLTLAGSALDLIRAIRRRRPALVHTHGYKAGLIGRFVARALSVPVVSTFHAGEPGSGRLRFYAAADRATARLATCVAVSEAIRERLPPGSALVDNFVDLPAPVPAAAGRRPRVVAFVGRLSQEKGPDTFCELAAMHPHLEFRLYGDGPLRPPLEASSDGRARFLGMVPAMDAHWRDIGLLCMPSRHEGLPMAALEAMANGVPVAAYAVGALPRCIDHGRTGWLVAPGDLPAMAAAIAAWHAQDEKAASAMSAAARADVARTFSPAAGVEKVLRVYAEAMARQR